MTIFRLLSIGVLVSLLALALLATTPQAQAKNVTYVIEAKDVVFSPDYLRVEPGDNVTIIVFNNESGPIPHTFELDEFNVHLGTLAAPIPRGENRSVTFIADRAGTFYFYCRIEGHATHLGGGRWTNMAGRLQVGPPPPADLMPVIVGGLAVVSVSVAIVVYAARRAATKRKSQ